MPEHRSHQTFNQTLLTNPVLIEEGTLRLKSASKADAIDSQSSSYKKSGSQMKSHNKGDISESTLMSIDSCTKTITADALRKMVKDNPQKFPQGLDTQARIFLPELRRRFPKSPYILGDTGQSATQELTEQITLRDLLNHTSGLGNQTHKDFDERIKPKPNHRLREGELLELDREKGAYGESKYSNQGYELLGMIMCAVEQDVQQRDTRDPIKFSEVLGKYSLASRGLEAPIYASDQMVVVDGKAQVVGHPELEVTCGRYYHDGILHESRPFNYDQLGAGGCYASTNTMIEYMDSLTYDELKEIIETNNPTTIGKGDKHYLLIQECGGFNMAYMEVETGTINISFGGMGFGNNSGAIWNILSRW